MRYNMVIFYYDKTIETYEKNFNYQAIIDYLKCLFTRDKKEEFLTSLIGYTWFFLVEGEVINDIRDWNQRLSEFKYCIDLGLSYYNYSDRICYITGYVLDLHGFYLGNDYENKGLSLMRRCVVESKNDNIRRIAEYFIKNAESNKSQKHNSPENIAKIVCELFPSKSILDLYFKIIYN